MQRRHFLEHSARAAVAFGILRRIAACAPVGSGPDAAFDEIRNRYFLKALEFNPVISTYLGGDGYSPLLALAGVRLRDFSPAALDKERIFYRGIRSELEKVHPGALSPRARIDREVLAAQVGFWLHQLDDLRYHEKSVDTYVTEPFRGIDWLIQQMTDGESGGPSDSRTVGQERGSEEEWKQVIERVRATPAYLETAKGNLQAGKSSGNLPDRRMVARDGIKGSHDNAEYFRKSLPESARGFLGERPFAATVLADLTAACNAAGEAWEGFAKFLSGTYDPDEKQDRYVAGKPEYEWRLRNCFKETRTTEELYEYGALQVALYQAKVYHVAEEVAREAKLGLPFGSEAEKLAGVRKVMEYLSRESPRDDDELFRWYREAAERAVAYGRERGLFDIPADYRLEITPTPPVLRSTVDATYFPAPPFKKAGVGRFYLTPTENDPAALKLNNHASVADTAVHEGFPGHDWHFKYMTQHASEISNIRWLTPGSVEDSAAMWEDSMATEGWGLYSEELMAEPAEGRPHGFYTAGEHLYELQGQLLRAVRVRVDVGLHTGRMTFDQAIDYFTEHVAFYPGARQRAAQDPAARAILAGAERAIYRYSKWPTQAITYNLGKNAIIELRDQVRAKLGEKYSAREFHEKLMRMGTVPAGYFRGVWE